MRKISSDSSRSARRVRAWVSEGRTGAEANTESSALRVANLVVRRRGSRRGWFGMPPCLAELIAVEEPQNAGDEKKHELVKRAGHGCKPERSTPSNRSVDPAVSNHDCCRANGPGNEQCRSHEFSLGRDRNHPGAPPRRVSSYPPLVLSIQRLRERMPLIAFILLLVLLMMMIGVACACATDHPMKTVDQELSAASSIGAVIEVWTYSFAAILLVAFVLPQRHRALGRASPQQLQRFLF